MLLRSGIKVRGRFCSFCLLFSYCDVETVVAVTSIVYEIAQNNADNLAISSVLDASSGTLDFSAHPEILYSYEKSIERSDFVLSAGFEMTLARDVVLVAQPHRPGFICHANASSPAGRTCETLVVDTVLRGSLVTSRKAIVTSEAPPAAPDSTVGKWEPTVHWVVLSFVKMGVYGFKWHQWKGLPLGQEIPGQRAIGSQVVAVTIGKFTEVLQAIHTTQNTAIAVWTRDTGELLATNGNALTINPATIIGITAKSLWPTEYPDEHISLSAALLLEKYGTYAAMPNSTSHTFNSRIGRLFVEARSIQDDFGLSWYLAVIIPENDLLGSIKQSRKVVTATAVGIAMGMMVFAAAMAYIIALPLRVLTTTMEKATNYDFSMLRDGYLKESNSFVREIAVMEQVFSTMLNKFAGAIDNRKRLQGYVGSSSSYQPTSLQAREISANGTSVPSRYVQA
ncbi:hypothetical protein DFJ77DRAFT_479201 [Powellomyces hirtus]|nr:hypothetical protein DFJ77DRAFT_479201 [Powellomyces hirtus]